MKSRNRILSLLLVSLLALLTADLGQSQNKTTPIYTPPKATYTPPPAPRPQRAPAPQPQRAPAPQQQSSPAPRPQYSPAPQSQSSVQRQSQTAPARAQQHTQVQRQEQAREQASQRKGQQKQQQDQARQQKEQQKQQQKQQQEQVRQQKQQQKQQQEQVRQQKQQQKEQQKQQQKQQKEQAREQKQQQKERQKQQMELARQQKEQQKQASTKKVTPSAPASSANSSAPRSSSRATVKGPVSVGGPSAKSAPQGTVLSPNESRSTIQRVNSLRSSMTGINRKPLPSGEVTGHSNGRMTVKAEGGRQYGVRSNGTLASYRDREKTVSFDKRGKISSIHTANMDVYRGTHGQRTIVSRRADGSKVVSTGPHSGYVERNIVANNRTYVQRTTVVNQRVYTSTSVVGSHGGLIVGNFVPPVFFAPGFYGWAFYPWAAPIGFSWGWFGAPWYLGPNPYFVASPLYPSASLWLTDYMIADTLATAYELNKEAGLAEADAATDDAANADMTAGDDSETSDHPETVHADVTTPITPELKAQIAEEVKQELANDNAAAANTSQVSFDVLPTALRSTNHVFVVSNDLDVTTTDQQICALQAGDMLQLLAPAESDAGLVQLRVASSKRMNCPAGVLVSVSRQDLQEMQNNFQARVEAGLEKLHNDHGLAGLPAAPADPVAAPPRPAVEGLAPISAAESSAMLDQQQKQADHAESEALTSTF